MGLYDRDYYRRQRPTWHFPTPRTAVGVLLIVNIGIYLLENVLSLEQLDLFIRTFGLSGDVLAQLQFARDLEGILAVLYGFRHVAGKVVEQHKIAVDRGFGASIA